MILDVAVIALSLAALAYVGRSMLRPRTAVAHGLGEGIAEGSTARMPQVDTGAQTLSLDRLRDALPRRVRPDAASRALPDAAPDLSRARLEPEPKAGTRSPRPEAPATAALAETAPAPDDHGAKAAAPLDVLIDVGGPGAPEVEVVDLSDPEDVCALEFAENPTGHLHLLHGRAEAQLEAGLTRTAWLDVYLSRSDWLDRRDLDAGGEFPDTLATHVLRIDLGRTVTAPDGAVTGAINEDPELYFDRDIASEIDFSV